MATDREQRGPHVGTTSERREKHVKKEKKAERKEGWHGFYVNFFYILPKHFAFH